MEWWPVLIFHRGGLRIKVINNTCLFWTKVEPNWNHAEMQSAPKKALLVVGVAGLCAAHTIFDKRPSKRSISLRLLNIGDTDAHQVAALAERDGDALFL